MKYLKYFDYLVIYVALGCIIYYIHTSTLGSYLKGFMLLGLTVCYLLFMVIERMPKKVLKNNVDNCVTASYIVNRNGKLQTLFLFGGNLWVVSSNGAFGQRDTYLEVITPNEAKTLIDKFNGKTEPNEQSTQH